MATLPITGGCECGAVRYEITAQPLLMFKCHCRPCQLVSGGAYTPVVVVESKAFKITRGALKYHFTSSVRGEGHPNKRGFCPECGSRVTGGETRRALPWLGVTASSLDDPSLFKSTYDIFVSHAQPWDALDPATLKYQEHAPKR